MKKHYFLGLAAGYSGRQIWRHTFTVGRERDRAALQRFLTQKYKGQAILTKNGRSALALALKAYFEPGDAVIVNGFTCYAVYEAIKAAKLIPIWVDINKSDLNFDANILEGLISDSKISGDSRPYATNEERNERSSARNDGPKRASRELPKSYSSVKGIIIQNSLGNPVDIVAIEKFARKHNLVIIEDLAHCAGVKYADGREAGTVGAATALSFGKDKAIDTISGGAVIFRDPCKTAIETPSKLPKISDTLRARFYPLFGAMSRGLSHIHLGGLFTRCLVRIHWIEKSADSKLDLERKIAKFEAKLALRQLKDLKKSGEPPLREFYLVRDRVEVLKKLQENGYYFGGFWYERPVSPERYYKKVHFPEDKCPVSTEVAAKIINFPTHYEAKALKRAHEIITEYIEENKE